MLSASRFLLLIVLAPVVAACHGASTVIAQETDPPLAFLVGPSGPTGFGTLTVDRSVVCDVEGQLSDSGGYFDLHPGTAEFEWRADHPDRPYDAERPVVVAMQRRSWVPNEPTRGFFGLRELDVTQGVIESPCTVTCDGAVVQLSYYVSVGVVTEEALADVGKSIDDAKNEIVELTNSDRHPPPLYPDGCDVFSAGQQQPF